MRDIFVDMIFLFSDFCLRGNVWNKTSKIGIKHCVENSK